MIHAISGLLYQDTDEEEEPDGEAQEKKFQCGTCNRGFARKYDMEKHTRRHTGEKPYQCGVCGKKFVQVGTSGERIGTRDFPLLKYFCL